MTPGVHEAQAARGYQIEVVTRWGRTDPDIVCHADCVVAYRIVQPGPLESRAAATAMATGRLDRLLEQKYATVVRRLKPMIPDRTDKRRRFDRYAEKLGVRGLLKSKLGRATWPILAAQA